MTPFVLRRKKLQVLQELPKKIETVRYCEMTDEQRVLYRDVLQRSKSYLIQNAADSPAPVPKKKKDADDILQELEEPKPRGKGKSQKAAAPVKKGVLKPADNSSNVLMDLRKAANHPMLFRRIYDDKTIRAMSKDCLKELEFSEKNPQYIYEDMEVMTDYELHRFVQPYKVRSNQSLTHLADFA